MAKAQAFPTVQLLTFRERENLAPLRNQGITEEQLITLKGNNSEIFHALATNKCDISPLLHLFSAEEILGYAQTDQEFFSSLCHASYAIPTLLQAGLDATILKSIACNHRGTFFTFMCPHAQQVMALLTSANIKAGDFSFFAQTVETSTFARLFSYYPLTETTPELIDYTSYAGTNLAWLRNIGTESADLLSWITNQASVFSAWIGQENAILDLKQQFQTLRQPHVTTNTPNEKPTLRWIPDEVIGLILHNQITQDMFNEQALKAASTNAPTNPFNHCTSFEELIALGKAQGIVL